MGITYKKEAFAARLSELYEADPERSLEKLGKIAAGKGKSISPQAAHKWLNGQSVPTSDKARNIAAHYNVTRHWLLFGDSPKRPMALNIAQAADMLADDDMQELAKYAARLLDSCKEVPRGVSHDQFIAKLKALSAALRSPH